MGGRWAWGHRLHGVLVVLVAAALVSTACSSPDPLAGLGTAGEQPGSTPADGSLGAPGSTATDASEPDEGGDEPARPADPERADLVVHTDRVLAEIDPMVLGTNVPAWLLPDLLTDLRFVQLTQALGTTLLRLPGGSWSNDYDWLGCERDDDAECFAAWGASPSDLLGFMVATGLPGMWTAAFNGTAEEAAAAVAFFNGTVGDQRPIGVDRGGRDWGVVGEWAALRAEHGFPEPVPITHWEVGNEIYGAVADAGPACAPWGWENVWTCDPAEYVHGDDSHDGLLAFAEAMTAVDPTIKIGAVGVGDRGEWGNWDDVVIREGRTAIDFYVVHHYGSDGDRPVDELLDVPREAWPRITTDVRRVFTDYGLPADTQIAVTEHNMVSFIDADEARLMPSAANAFYLADTIGQLIASGVPIANQWNLMNGRAANGSDYGLIDGTTMQRAPAYYAMALWARAGRSLVEVAVGPDAELGDLRVYGLIDADGAPRVLAFNPTGEVIRASLAVEPERQPDGSGDTGGVVAHVVAADSLGATTMSFNGVSEPSPDLSDPPVAVSLGVAAEPAADLDYQFAPYSLTLLEWTPIGAPAAVATPAP